MNEIHALPHLIRSRAADGHASSNRELLRFVKIRPDGSYLVRSRSYAQLWASAQAIAKAMLRVDLRKGDRVAAMMENHPEFVDTIVAASILGVVVVPIDPRTRGEKLAYLLSSTGCSGAIVGDYCLEALASVKSQCSLKWIWHVEDGARPAGSISTPLAEVIAGSAAEPDLVSSTTLDDDMAYMPTSGTTGNPKSVRCNYRRYAMKGIDNRRWFDIRPDDVMYTGLSLTHGNAQNMSLAVALYNNIPLVFSQRFTKTRLWKVVKDFHCTSMTMLGGMYAALFAEPPSPLDRTTAMRLIVGAGMPKALWLPFSDRFAVEILEYYSASEGGMTLNRPGEGPVGSIGRATDGWIAEIFDEQDVPCAPGVVGEMVFRLEGGTAPVVRYVNNPEASARKTRGGWLRSGDLAWKDEEGWLYFVSRKEYEIRRNGEFISAGFIEKEIAAHPSVSDVFVYGIDSPGLGTGEKDIVAAVVWQGRQLDPRELFEFCAARMERNALPSYLQVVAEIPKTASEKPVQNTLVAMFSAHPENVFSASQRSDLRVASSNLS